MGCLRSPWTTEWHDAPFLIAGGGIDDSPKTRVFFARSVDSRRGIVVRFPQSSTGRTLIAELLFVDIPTRRGARCSGLVGSVSIKARPERFPLSTESFKTFQRRSLSQCAFSEDSFSSQNSPRKAPEPGSLSIVGTWSRGMQSLQSPCRIPSSYLSGFKPSYTQ